MNKVLQDIWILSDSGVVMFSRVYDERINAQLFGAFMTALNSFAQAISHSSIKCMELSNKRFSFLKKDNVLFIANSDKKYKEKHVHKELEIIIQKFFELYADELKTWKGDISLFSSFKKEIENSLEERLEKFKRSFW